MRLIEVIDRRPVAVAFGLRRGGGQSPGGATLSVTRNAESVSLVTPAGATPLPAATAEVAGVLGEYRKTAVVVQGHTDSTGSEAHNEQLSNRRANAVEAYLVGRGVDRGRITSVGYGEAYPVASNASESGRQLNRRVDVLIKAKA